MLKEGDVRSLTVAMEGLNNILETGRQFFPDENGENQFAIAFEECEGIEALEMLQKHKNQTIYSKSLHLLEEFFNLESFASLSEPVKTTAATQENTLMCFDI